MKDEKMGSVVVFKNDPKCKGCDEYVCDRETGATTCDINKAHIFQLSMAAARLYADEQFHGMAPRGHLAAKVLLVKRSSETVTRIVAGGE